MLTASQFSVGALMDAQPLTLLLPRTKYEYPVLVGGTAEEHIAVFIDGQHSFASFVCNGNDHWKGLLVPHVSIEVDPTTAFDPEVDYTPDGTIVRREEALFIAAQGKEQFSFSRQVLVPLVSGLSSAGQHRVGFYKWEITLGQGVESQALFKVDVSPPAKPDA